MVRRAILLLALAAQAQDRRVTPESPRRAALIAGNAAYPDGPLRNPVNDARALADTLRPLGFEVQLALDTTRQSLEAAVDTFAKGLHPGDIALFYYSGHGLQVDGVNYLVPVDFHAAQESEVPYQAYAAALVHDRMRASGASLSILILDACRDNPFRRAPNMGLAPMNAGRGSFIAFAAGPGQTASDNPTGSNGLFTQYLLETLAQPGLELEQVFKRVRERVDAASQGRQVPWTASSVIGAFVFRDPARERAKLEADLRELERQIADARQRKAEQEQAEKEREAAALRIRIAAPAPAPAAPDKTIEELRQKRDERQAELQALAGQTMTFEEAQREVASLEQQIDGLRKQYNDARGEALRRLPPADKDQFETTAAFHARKDKTLADRAAVTRQYTEEFESAAKPFRGRIVELQAGAYPLPGAKLEFVSYDADQNRLTARIDGDEYAFAVPSAAARSLYSEIGAVRVERSPGGPAALTLVDPATLEKFPGRSSGRINPKDGLRYVWIPPGTFAMGCSPDDAECFAGEKPSRTVTIAKGFWMGQTPITQEAFQKVTGQNPSHFKGPHLPVESIKWDQAHDYCEAIGGRLPTEVEWEYAARAGTTGSRYGSLDDIAWYAANSGNQTHEVGRKEANAFGLFDMLGNVREWTADWYEEKYHAMRGGSWGSTPRVLRVSYRYKDAPAYRIGNVGARCVW